MICTKSLVIISLKVAVKLAKGEVSFIFRLNQSDNSLNALRYEKEIGNQTNPTY